VVEVRIVQGAQFRKQVPWQLFDSGKADPGDLEVLGREFSDVLDRPIILLSPEPNVNLATQSQHRLGHGPVRLRPGKLDIWECCL
jgi:hypothetical protein